MSWETSDDFRATIHRPHRRVVRIEVLRGGSTQAVVPITGGTVNADATQATRRRATIPLVDQAGDLVPGVPEDLLYPSGDELRAWRGIDFGDDRAGHPVDVAPPGTELVPVFTGPLIENDVDDQPDGIKLSLDCYDRSRFVQRARWTTPYLIPGGAKWTDVVAGAIRDRVPPSIPLSFARFIDDDATVARDFAVGGDPQGNPWENITKWAAGPLGCEVFFDGLGNPVLRDVPNVHTTTVSARYREGQGGGLLGVKKRVSLERAYNIVVASAQGTGLAAPIQAIARDDDPESATYTGTLGELPIWYTSPLLHTAAQCARAARSRLNKRIGSTVTLQFDAMVNPAHEPGDVVEVVRARSKVDLRVILDAFPVPFDTASPAGMAGRSRTA